MKSAIKKRGGKANKKSGNVIRIYGEISSFLDKHSHDDEDVNQAPVKKSRKQQRKDDRKAKKMKKNVYFSHLKNPSSIKNSMEEVVENDEKKDTSTQVQKNVINPTKKIRKVKSKTFEEKVAENRRKLQLNQLKEDDIVIKRLEKQMKLNKRKSKKLPQSFVNDGLDFLLNFCDTENRLTLNDPDLDDSATDFGSDSEGSDTRESVEIARKKRKVEISTVDVENNNVEKDGSTEKKQLNSEGNKSSSSEDSAGDCMDENSSDDEISHDESSNDESNESHDDKTDSDANDDSKKCAKISKDKTTDAGGHWEDIYGRLRDREGNIIKDNKTNSGKYIPPARRLDLSVDVKKKEKMERLKRQVKGQINRLSESNLYAISHQVEELYLSNSRHDMNETLTDIIMQSCVSPVLTPDRLISEHAMFIAVLHANVGIEVGAYVVQDIADKFIQLEKEGGDYGIGKESDNLLLLLAHLYNFKVIHCTLIVDILKKLGESFREKDIELILLLLKSVGFTLRKDDPVLLKDVITQLQSKSATAADISDKNRVRFMLETLMAIKNNNVQKIPNYDPSLIEHQRKILRTLLRKGRYVSELTVTLDDLTNVNERGRWWIVGSAWNTTEEDPVRDRKDVSREDRPLANEKILDLAAKQRMNTDTRKNIFCVIMAAEDYLDAFEKLLRLGLKNQQEREIIFVVLDCCLRERKFNPYYSFIIQKFCEYDRRFQMTTQCAIWDRLKDSDSSKLTWANLASLISQLLTKNVLPISVLKVVHFADMNKKLVRFLRQILLAILLESEDVCRVVFKRVAPSEKLRMFREGLRLFILHFIRRNKDKLVSKDLSANLDDRCDIACSALNSADSKIKL